MTRIKLNLRSYTAIMLVVNIVLILLILSLRAHSQVTRTEVNSAKLKYINDRKAMLKDTSAYLRDITTMDSLYYEGLRAIRHDQKIPRFLRK